MNYAVGHNVAGYMPEADVYVTDEFVNAKSALIYDLLFAADYAETDEIGNCLALAAEEVDLSPAGADNMRMRRPAARDLDRCRRRCRRSESLERTRLPLRQHDRQ